MPSVQVYVNAADKAWLDDQPAEVTAAALMRGAIARERRLGEECSHDLQELVCLDCGRRRPAPSTEDVDID